MSADLAARLRELAQDHHAGRFDLATYRKLRAPLLDSLETYTGPIDEMAVTQPRALGRANATLPRTEAATPPAQGLKVPRWILAIVPLLLIAAGAWWALRSSTPETQVAEDDFASVSPVQEVIEPFVRRGDWSDAHVAALNVALLELGEQQIGAVAGEPWFQRFVDDLRKRFKEQQALVQKPLTAKSSPLAALAVTVGLDLKSPDAAIRISAVSTPVQKADTSPSASTPPPHVREKETPREPRAQQRAAKVEEAHASEPKATIASAPVSGTAPTTSPAATPTNATNPCRAELARSRRPFCEDTLRSGLNGPRLALIPAGEFVMGSDAAASEQPVHRVTIREPFAISVHEISQAEFKAFCDDTGRACPAQPWPGDDYPAVNVSWNDARAYVEWLSSATGYRYRLPSEAQWEYAARAGETGLVPRGDKLSPTDAHFSMLTNLTTPAQRSQKFNENAFRVLHVLGNVREWVEDGWVDNYSGAPSDGSAVNSSVNDMRVVRGGSYADTAAKLRLSLREGLPSDTRDALTGFRVLREVP